MVEATLAVQPERQRDVGPLSILVVEDSEITLNLLQLLLTQRGHIVECLTDGDAARRALAGGDYDVCLIDFHLPTVDGLRVVREYREHNPDRSKRPQFIGMTADIEGLLAHPANCENLDMVFSKPIVADEVYAAVERSGSVPDRPSMDGSGRGMVMNFPPQQAAAVAGNRSSKTASYESPETGELLPDRRRSMRKVVSLSGTTLTRKNGETFDCRIVMLSFLGASLETSGRLDVGELIMVGRTQARVVRVGKEVAVEFVRQR